MTSSENWLLCDRLRELAGEVAASSEGAAQDRLWREMERVIEKAGAEEDADLMLPVLERSLPDVHVLFDGWRDGTVPLPEWDKAVLKRALKAFRKRLKIARLDDESSGSRDPLSKGEHSSILGVRPPEQYLPRIWDLLVEQGRLRDGGHGLLELAS